MPPGEDWLWLILIYFHLNAKPDDIRAFRACIECININIVTMFLYVELFCLKSFFLANHLFQVVSNMSFLLYILVTNSLNSTDVQ